MKKSLVATVACAVAVSLGMTSCKKEGIHIGVIQHVEHDALNASYKGFVDALKDAGYEDGKNIHIDYENAQNDQSNNVTIADKFANDNVDLILAIATPSAAAAAARTEFRRRRMLYAKKRPGSDRPRRDHAHHCFVRLLPCGLCRRGRRVHRAAQFCLC